LGVKDNEIYWVDEFSNPDENIDYLFFWNIEDWSASWIITLVELSLLNPSYWHTDNGSKLILALKSRSARLIFV